MENNKELSVKEYFLYTLLALCGFAIWYLGTAFVILDLNVSNWEESTRFLVLSEGTITSIALVAITKISRS
jgi:hypothetical protein